MNGHQVAAITAIVTGTVHLLVGGLLLVKRRRLHPIRGRSVPLVLGFTIPNNIEYIFLLLVNAFPEHFSACSPIDLAVHAFGSISLSSIFFRTWRLWFLFFAAREKLELVEPLESHDKGSEASQSRKSLIDSTWFMRHRGLVSGRFFAKAILVTSVVFTSILVAQFYGNSRTEEELSHPWFEDSQHCYGVQIDALLRVAFSGVAALLILVLAFKIRNVKDNYKLKPELYLLLVYACLKPVVSRTSIIGGAFGIQVTFLISIDLPVIWSYFHAKKMEATSASGKYQSDIPTLSEVLTNDEHSVYRDSFKLHLVQEFSIENYLLVKEVEDFKKKYHPADDDKTSLLLVDQINELHDDVLRIYCTFFAKDSPNEVNVSYVMCERIRTSIHDNIPNFDRRFTKMQKSVANSYGYASPEDVALFGVTSIEIPSSVERKHSHSKSVTKSTHSGRTADAECGSSEQNNGSSASALSVQTLLSVFDEAHKAIFKLMEQDTFRSWKAVYRRGAGSMTETR